MKLRFHWWLGFKWDVVVNCTWISDSGQDVQNNIYQCLFLTFGFITLQLTRVKEVLVERVNLKEELNELGRALQDELNGSNSPSMRTK